MPMAFVQGLAEVSRRIPLEVAVGNGWEIEKVKGFHRTADTEYYFALYEVVVVLGTHRWCWFLDPSWLMCNSFDTA